MFFVTSDTSFDCYVWSVTFNIVAVVLRMMISMSELSDPILFLSFPILVMAGWGGEVFTAYSHWWFIPLLSCHLGAILGAGAYLLLVELHWPRQEPLQHPKQQDHHHDLASPVEEDGKKANAKLPSLTRPGFGSNFLNVSRKFASHQCRWRRDAHSYLLISISLQYSNLYHQNEITAILEKEETVGETKGPFSRVRHKKDVPDCSYPPEVMYSVVKKPKKSKSR